MRLYRDTILQAAPFALKAIAMAHGVRFVDDSIDASKSFDRLAAAFWLLPLGWLLVMAMFGSVAFGTVGLCMLACCMAIPVTLHWRVRVAKKQVQALERYVDVCVVAGKPYASIRQVGTGRPDQQGDAGLVIAAVRLRLAVGTLVQPCTGVFARAGDVLYPLAVVLSAEHANEAAKEYSQLLRITIEVRDDTYEICGARRLGSRLSG